MRSRLVLSTILLLTLVGCGVWQAAPTPGLPSPLPTPSPSPSVPTPTPTEESKPLIVTLTLWLPEEFSPYGEGPGAGLLAEQLDGFEEEYPDLQVEVIVKKAHGRGGLLDFLRTASIAAPSVLPDLVVLDAAELETAAGAGLIRPLDGLLPSELTADRFPFASQLGQIEGQTMGFVLAADVEHVAYRPALFEQLILTPTETITVTPPVRWTQVVSASAPYLFPAAGRGGQVNDATLIQYLALGGTLAARDGTPQLDAELLAEVFAFYRRAAAAGVISPTVVLGLQDADAAWELYQQGEGSVTLVRASRFLAEADEESEPLPVPTRDGNTCTIARRGWVVALVSTDPARQRLAAMLLEWLVSPQRNGPWCQTVGALPGTRAALAEWELPEARRDFLADLLAHAVARPPAALDAIVGPPMQEALEAVLRGRATPRQAAADAASAVEQ